jgi:hypothetical protein
MKAHSKTTKQSGFFDLGLSLVILALAGGTVLLVESEQQENIETAANQQPMTAEVMTVDTGNAATTVQ